MKCNVCGSDNVEGSIFCEDCGSKLSAPAPAFGAVSAAPAPFSAAVPQAAPVSAAAAPAPAAPFSAAVPQAAPVPAAAAPAPAAPFSAAVPQAAPVPAAAAPAPAAPFSAAVPQAAPAAAAPAPAVSAVVCQACGASNEAGSKFCEDCGASLAPLPQAAAAPAPAVSVVAPVPSTPEPVAAPVITAPKLIMPNGVAIPLSSEHTLLGRQSPADNIYPEIDLTELDPESYVSRRHGQITRQGSKFLYEDIGSSNGSWINGARLESKIQTELHDGDVLRLGRTEITFRM
ncbi:MAG: FHA domain-containing protein [Candidatus Bruticola sp.]